MCGIWLAASQVDELRWIEAELVRVDAARAWLFRRRTELLAELSRAQDAATTQASRPATPPALPAAPPVRPPARPRAELSGRAVARLLLAAGTLLVVIAAAAFTVANWSSIGPLGRIGILLGVTVLVLLAPKLPHRRNLAATAESVAMIGLALTVGDAYLAGRLLHLNVLTTPFAAAAVTAGLAVAWAAYGSAVGLRGPRLAAIGLAQLPLLYITDGLVRSLGGTAYSIAGPLAVVLAATAAADLRLASWYESPDRAPEPAAASPERGARGADPRAEALVVALLATGAWISGILLAAGDAVTGPALPAALWLGAALGLAALIGLTMWPRSIVLGPSVPPVAVVSGVAITGLAVPIAVVLPASWKIVAFAAVSAAAVVSALAVRSRVSVPGDPDHPVTAGHLRLGLAAAGASATLVATSLFVLPGALGALFEPRLLLHAWTGSVSEGPARLISGSVEGWPTLIVLGLLAGVSLLAPIPKRAASRCLAAAAAALAFASLPVAVHAGGWARLGLLTAGVAVLAAVATGRSVSGLLRDWPRGDRPRRSWCRDGQCRDGPRRDGQWREWPRWDRAGRHEIGCGGGCGARGGGGGVVARRSGHDGDPACGAGRRFRRWLLAHAQQVRGLRPDRRGAGGGGRAGVRGPAGGWLASTAGGVRRPGSCHDRGRDSDVD